VSLLTDNHQVVSGSYKTFTTFY